MPAHRTTTERSATGLHDQTEWARDAGERLSDVIGRAQRTGQAYYAVVEIVPPAADPLDLLHNARIFPALFWRDRDGDREYACLGAVATLKSTGTGALREATDRAPELLERCVPLPAATEIIPPRLFAGFAFDYSPRRDSLWAGYDDAVVILPELIYLRDRMQVRAFITIEVNPRSRAGDLIEVLEKQRIKLIQNSHVPEQTIIPSVTISGADEGRHQWDSAVDIALRRMRDGGLEKVVLSRRVNLSAESAIPVWPLMQRLRSAAAGCFHFAFGMSADRTFVGASPERLFRLQNREIETECMAGTTERGTDASADHALAEALLASEKDRLEHYYVLEDSLRCLGDLCTTMNADTNPCLVRLSTLQHLATTVRGRLKDGVGIGEILQRLHPTPAVGGTPRAAALAAIRELEPHPRGWYAGPVGWLERDRAEFAVAIRSALLSGTKACVFAGAGIVPGSAPEKEWIETRNKALAFLKAVWG
jgi:isochorismate synthase